MRRASTFLRRTVPLLLLLAARPAVSAAEPAIRFLDGDGRPADRILFYRDYQVEIADPAGDLDPGTVNSAWATIFSSEWGMDFPIAWVFAEETGVGTGVFRGSFRVVAPHSAELHGAAIPVLEVAAGATLTARDTLQDPDVVDTSAPAGLFATLDLVGADGRPLAETLEGVPLHLRLIDADQNPGLLESRTVSVGSRLGGDLESVLLWENGAYSGVFTGSLPSRFLTSGSGTSGDGELGVAADPQLAAPATGETIDLNYAGAGGNPPADAALPTLAARLELIDGGLPATVLVPNDGCRLELRLAYPALAASGGSAVFQVDSGADSETFTQNPGPDGLYTLELPCAPGPANPFDGYLGALPGDTLEVSAQVYYGHSGELEASLPVAGARLRFVDLDDGAPLASAPDLRPFKVQLIEATNNPAVVESRSVGITPLIAFNDRPLELVETSAWSGIYEAVVEPGLGLGPGENALQVARRHSGADRGGVFDQITVSGSASGGSVAAVLPLTGPVVEWIDSVGGPADRLRFGSQAQVLVDDPGFDQNPGVAETCTVDILEGPAGSETLTLTETGPHTGVFEGSVPVLQGQSSGGDGVLQLHPAEAFAVLHYQMANPWGGYLRRRIQGTSAGQLFFVDEDGNPATTLLEGEELHLRLRDFDPARSPTIADQLTVRLRSALGLDDEELTLVETSGASGVFEGSLPTALGPPAAPASWGDGILALARGAALDRVLATSGGAAAEAELTAGRLRFLDRLGREIERIGTSQQLVVELTRPAGGDSQIAEVLPWALRLEQLGSGFSQDREYPNLVETGSGTGIFRAEIWLSDAFGWPPAGDGTLQIDPRYGFIHARYGSAPAIAEKSLQIFAGGNAPYPSGDTVELAAGASVTLDLLANDVDPHGEELTLGSVTPLYGAHYTSATIGGDGRVTLSGAADAHGRESLLYLFSNESGLIAEGFVTVQYETPPTLTILGPANGSVFSEQSAIHLAAAAADLDDGDLGSGIQWSSSLRPHLGYGPNPVVPAGYLPTGTHLVTATVSDQAGNLATTAVTIVVIPANTAPVVAIGAPASGTRLALGDSVTLSGSATDAESGDLAASLAWTSNLAGSLGTGATLATSALGVGSHTITAAVTDSGGLAGSASITLQVQVAQTATFVSAGALDGFVLESGENTNTGGQVSSGQLRLGDNLADRQYRAFLSFDTASLPDTALIRKVTVKAMRSGVTGVNPATTHGSLSADVKNGFFGASTALENADFADSATAFGVSVLTPAAANGAWTEGVFDAAGRAAISLAGTTQVRLQLALDDDDDATNDYLDHYGGESTVASTRPQLIVEYLP